MLPDDDFCYILVVSRGEPEPDDRVMELAEREAAQSGVDLGPYLGLWQPITSGPLYHTFLGLREDT